ncbi:MAG: NTP transferase domain-containing protein [Muribaculaceae bacterium]|nr:NTP transferase domain-containing protein [Muribaculaceae bacterium]MDE6753227.1 NTP transferase domain-containing protein [Muribaculaceae bacterium]
MAKRNAIILAAGTSTRFVPLSEETPKALLNVKGEVLIERQIRQLREAGVDDITVVTGYKAEMFEYLEKDFGVRLVFNEDYARYNNTSSLIRVIDRLDNTFVCSSDNYFPDNVFLNTPDNGFYSSMYSEMPSGEYFLATDEEDRIMDVRVGGSKGWYMVGHVYFDSAFSKAFSRLLSDEYSKEETRLEYWEDIYRKYISVLPPLFIKRYCQDEIREFDTLDELRDFDPGYIDDTRSPIIRSIAEKLGCREGELSGFLRESPKDAPLEFSFLKDGSRLLYRFADDSISIR